MKKFLAIILALAALLTLAACGSEGKGGARRDPNKVYLEDYLVFEEKGFDGKGQVSVRMDWDALIADNSQWLEKAQYDEEEGSYTFSYVDKDGMTYRYCPNATTPEDAVMSLVSSSSSMPLELSISMTPLRSNFQATQPEAPREPPHLSKMWRISLAVRFRLSVTTSTITATPQGA